MGKGPKTARNDLLVKCGSDGAAMSENFEVRARTVLRRLRGEEDQSPPAVNEDEGLA